MKGSVVRVLFRSASLMSVIRVAWNLAKHVYKPKNSDKATFYSPAGARVMPAPSSHLPEEREFVVDAGASMHLLSEKDLSSDEKDT